MSHPPLTRRPIALRYLPWASLIVPAYAFVDAPVSAWAHTHRFAPATKTLFRIARLPGNFAFVAIVVAVIVIVRRRDLRDFGAAMLTLAIASIGAAALKLACCRHRPSAGEGPSAWHVFSGRTAGDFLPGNLSFPSGDATLAFAAATVLASIWPRSAVVGFAWASVVAITRVCQGVHFPSDVLAGALVGTLCADVALRCAPWHDARQRTWREDDAARRLLAPR